MKFFISTLICFFCSLSLLFGQKQTVDTQELPHLQKDSIVHQLRIYEIPVKNRDVFHVRFRDHAHRIMKKYGFKIIAIWETTFEDKLEFVYLLEWENEKTMKSAWSAFMADQEWKDIKAATRKQHGDYVLRIEDRVLRPTDYTPHLKLIP